MIESDLATSLKLHADNLPVDKRVRELTPKVTKLYDLLQPEGRFDIDVSYAPDRSPPIVLNEFKVRDGSMKHDLFRYQVNTITGTIVQQDDKFVFNMLGQASGHQGRLTGYVRVNAPDDLEAPRDPAIPLRIRGVGRGASIEEQRYNARLIAAAPQLAEALRDARREMDSLTRRLTALDESANLDTAEAADIAAEAALKAAGLEP